MDRRFVIVSGLPGSGKSTLALQLAPALGLPLIDKDEILVRSFWSRGASDEDSRRSLSRESDVVLQAEARSSNGAVLVSFWRRPGGPDNSGTPTEWLSSLSPLLVEVHCACPPDIAASRFLTRFRHPFHGDSVHTYATLFAKLEAHDRLPSIDVGKKINVDTTGDTDVEILVREIELAFGRCATG